MHKWFMHHICIKCSLIFIQNNVKSQHKFYSLDKKTLPAISQSTKKTMKFYNFYIFLALIACIFYSNTFQ